MADSFLIAAAVSTALGFLSGLGVGGGSLLLLWLTLVAGKEPDTARLINLLFFLPSAALSCWFRWKQGVICIRQLLPVILSGCVGAAAGSIAAEFLPVESLRKLFGVLLLITGTRELLHKPKKQAS